MNKRIETLKKETKKDSRFQFEISLMTPINQKIKVFRLIKSNFKTKNNSITRVNENIHIITKTGVVVVNYKNFIN